MSAAWWPRQAWRQALQGWRHGEFTILALALFVAILALATVGAVASRTANALGEQSRALIGGDAAYSGDGAVPAAVRQAATERGLRSSHAVDFISMVGAGRGAPQLGRVHALDAGTPLLGPTRVRLVGRPRDVLRQRPSPGTLWLSESGARRIGAQAGQTIEVGGVPLRFEAVVLYEPDRPIRGVEMGPRVILNLADVQGTALFGEGVRYESRFAVAGAPDAVQAWVRAVRPLAQGSAKVETRGDIRPEIAASLDRAQRFLGIASVLTLVLAAVAIAICARQHAEAQRAVAATLRALGAPQRVIVGLYLGTLFLVAVLATLPAVAAAVLAQELGARWITTRLGTPLPAPGWQPFAEAVGAGWLVLLTFGAPPLIALRRVSALAVLRQDLRTPSPPALALFALGAAAILWQLQRIAGDTRIAAVLLGGLGLTLAALGVATLLLAGAIGRLGRRIGGVAGYALANLARRRRLTVTQGMALGTSLMVLMLLFSVRVDLWNQWQGMIRRDAPNRFVINVQPEQRATFNATLKALGLTASPFAALVRARVVQGPVREVQAQARNEREREFNLSSFTTLPVSNTLVAGRMWKPGARVNEFSVEERFAQRLGWTLGDTISFDATGRRITGRITSLRRVRWESFEPNFFVAAAPGMLDAAPATYIASVRVPPGDVSLATALATRIPNANVVDIDAIAAEIKRIGDQAAMVVQLVFWFAFIAGCLVFAAAVAATRSERSRELGIMRTLGSSTAQMRASQWLEFAALGAVIGLIAAMAAGGIGMLLATRVLDLPAEPHYLRWLTGAVLGAAAAVVTGALSVRRALNSPVREVLAAG